MRLPAVTRRLLTAHPLPLPRLGALVAAVLLAHAVLLGLGWPTLQRHAPWPAPEARSGAPQRLLQLRVLPAPQPARATAALAEAPSPQMPPREARPAAAQPQPQPQPIVLPGESVFPRPSPAPAARNPPPEPLLDLAPAPAPALLPDRAARPAALLAAPDDEPSGAAASETTQADGPPPLYPTRLPPPTQARYRLQYLGQPAEALLQWRHDGQRYQLNLASQGGPRPLLQQASRGELDANGLAPERFTDQRRGRGQRAANFQHEAGRISFSAAEWQLPAWPGAQDRLGWLVQLSGIAAAAAVAGTPLPDVRLYVADARGGAELWRFRAEGADTVALPIGPTAAQLWRREPDRPDGLRVEVWLDPARGHWPLRWRYTLLRTGAVIDWQLAEPPAEPPTEPPAAPPAAPGPA